jgi:hypothetical protein
MALVLTNTRLIECVNPTPLTGASVIFAPGHEDSFRITAAAGVKTPSGSDQGPPREAAWESNRLPAVGWAHVRRSSLRYVLPLSYTRWRIGWEVWSRASWPTSSRWPATRWKICITSVRWCW